MVEAGSFFSLFPFSPLFYFSLIVILLDLNQNENMSALDLRLLHLINVPAFHGHSVFQVRLCSKSRNYKPINIYFYQYFRIRAVAIFDAAHIVFDRSNRQCVPLRGRIFSSGDHVRSFSTLICVKCLASGFFLPYSL
jgi:hypothetical protein